MSAIMTQVYKLDDLNERRLECVLKVSVDYCIVKLVRALVRSVLRGGEIDP